MGWQHYLAAAGFVSPCYSAGGAGEVFDWLARENRPRGADESGTVALAIRVEFATLVELPV